MKHSIEPFTSHSSFLNSALRFRVNLRAKTIRVTSITPNYLCSSSLWTSFVRIFHFPDVETLLDCHSILVEASGAYSSCHRFVFHTMSEKYPFEERPPRKVSRKPSWFKFF